MAAHKILIVEDEVIVAMQIEDALRSMGYEVVGVASRGNDALRIAKDTWPDLILMDIRLEGKMDGIEAANRINMHHDIPVIFLTAYSDNATVKRAILTRSYGFLTKPFKEQELFSNIELAINRHRYRKRFTMTETIIKPTFSIVSDVNISTDPRGMILWVNDAAETALGWTREEAIGRDILDIMDAGVADFGTFVETVAGMTQTEGGQVSWPRDVVVTSKDGLRRKFSLEIEPISGVDGGLREIMLLFDQAKEKVKTESVLPLTPTQVIEVIENPAFILDRNMCLVLYNAAFQEFCAEMNVSSPVLRLPLFSFLPASLFGGEGSYVEVFARGEKERGGISRQTSPGTPGYVATKIPIGSGEAVAFVATILEPIE